MSITHLTFSREYTNAVEAKQVAQQEAERAKYIGASLLALRRCGYGIYPPLFLPLVSYPH